MAQKYSPNPIADGDYSADWGNDSNVNLPYSGENIQKFIKDELRKKYEQSDVEREVANQISDVVFGKGNSNVVTGISGNSSAINYTYRKFDGSAVTEGTGTIDISKVDVNDRFIAVTSQLSSNYINVGGECTLFYGYAITDYSSKIIENQYANGTLNLYRQGSAVPFYTASLGNVVSTSETGRTSGEINLTSILKQYITSSASIIATVSFAHTYTYQDTEEGSEIETTISRTINGQSSTTITVISIILNIAFIVLYCLYKIFKCIFNFIFNNKTEKVNEYHNNCKIVYNINDREIVSKIIKSFVSEVYNSRMLSETKYLFYSGHFTPTSERYKMYTAATNIMNDFLIIQSLSFSNINYPFNMKKMYIFYKEFEITITNYVKNIKDKYIEKGIVSDNLKNTIRICIEKNYINRYYSSNPEYYYFFFSTLINYFHSF